ncbi:MAG: CsbD family protein [Pseudomonadota bacterium]
MKGTIKEFAGKFSMNSDLEGAGKDEKRAGAIRQKIGEAEKVAGK